MFHPSFLLPLSTYLILQSLMMNDNNNRTQNEKQYMKTDYVIDFDYVDYVQK